MPLKNLRPVSDKPKGNVYETILVLPICRKETLDSRQCLSVCEYELT